MIELLQSLGLQHGPVAMVAAVFAYIGNKHFKADHARFNRLEDGFDAGLNKVEARLEVVSDQMGKNHAEILKMLVDQNRTTVEVASALAARRP